jgi:hypothetical protein
MRTKWHTFAFTVNSLFQVTMASERLAGRGLMRGFYAGGPLSPSVVLDFGWTANDGIAPANNGNGRVIRDEVVGVSFLPDPYWSPVQTIHSDNGTRYIGTHGAGQGPGQYRPLHILVPADHRAVVSAVNYTGAPVTVLVAVEVCEGLSPEVIECLKYLVY